MIHSVAVSLSARNDTSDKTQGGEESLRGGAAVSRGRLRAADNQTQGKVHGHIRPERRPVGPPVTQRCLWVRPRTGGSAGQVAGTRYPSQRLPATESPRHPLTWRPVASRLHDNQLALVPVGR